MQVVQGWIVVWVLQSREVTVIVLGWAHFGRQRRWNERMVQTALHGGTGPLGIWLGWEGRWVPASWHATVVDTDTNTDTDMETQSSVGRVTDMYV